jgi:hypothetical protein
LANGAAVGLCIAAVLSLACGIGLWTLKSYGRPLQIVHACLVLVLFPFGTLAAALTLLYLRKPGVRALFAGTPVAELSAAELKDLAPMGGESGIVAAALAGGVIIGSFFFLGLVSGIAVPSMLAAKMAANESAAIALLRQVQEEQTRYALQCGKGAFAGSFEALSIPVTDYDGSPLTRGTGESHSTERSGFVFMLERGAQAKPAAVDCKGRSTVTAWYASAVPQAFGASGRQSFATNGAGIIWSVGYMAAPQEPFGPPAVAVH